MTAVSLCKFGKKEKSLTIVIEFEAFGSGTSSQPIKEHEIPQQLVPVIMAGPWLVELLPLCLGPVRSSEGYEPLQRLAVASFAFGVIAGYLNRLHAPNSIKSAHVWSPPHCHSQLHCLDLLTGRTVWVTINAISVQTPQEAVRAARGKSVTLPCTYQTATSQRHGVIQWDKLRMDYSEKVISRVFETKQYSYGDRYENRVNVSGSADQSDASIIIDQLTMEDNGTYECSVILTNDMEGIAKSRVRLLVLVIPSKPVCGITGETVIGSNIELTCRSEEGSPAPQYSWKSYDILNQERHLAQPVTGQSFILKNITTDMSGYYICTASNEVGSDFCNITLAVHTASMNVALYAGIAGGITAALIVIGVIIYCCCCRSKGEAEDKEDERPNRRIYSKPAEQLQLQEQARAEDEEDDYRQEDQRSTGRMSPDHRGR
ncbi:PREDICTED: cell surface A33 antigen [Elephantulus edwardii]|uniref:cell surface A33 antigen n=1 Tax=Elephantulus edwardii TaxID=28737 RepID=UPI0003F07AA2|nr:PREDICTED: cell surface A33 antigen [Elephantulus edwardii]